MEKNNPNNPFDKKPDLETETFRAWITDEKDKDTMPKDSPTIQYKDMKLVLGGFNVVYNKDKKVVFAYKFKHDRKDILYYIDTDDEKVNTALRYLKEVAVHMGYVTTNMEETLKSMWNEKSTLDKLSKERKDEKQN